MRVEKGYPIQRGGVVTAHQKKRRSWDRRQRGKPTEEKGDETQRKLSASGRESAMEHRAPAGSWGVRRAKLWGRRKKRKRGAAAARTAAPQGISLNKKEGGFRRGGEKRKICKKCRWPPSGNEERDRTRKVPAEGLAGRIRISEKERVRFFEKKRD